MTKQTVFHGSVNVAYRQMYIDTRAEWSSTLEDTRAGQSNGLCGAVIPGYLFLTTGTHTGHVALTIEVHDRRPEVGDRWEDVVEVPFTPETTTTRLAQWGDADRCSFELARTDDRVRYCGEAMAAGQHADVVYSDEPPIDHYLLQFWPEAPSPDEVIRTTRYASYWHDVARASEPPPTPQERAEAEHEERLAEARAAEERVRRAELRTWGGRVPSDRLKHVGGNVHGMRELDMDLVHALAAVDDGTQREIARWAARRAYTAAGLAEIDWIAPALDALDHGRALPPPFDDHAAMFDRLLGDERIPHTTVALP